MRSTAIQRAPFVPQPRGASAAEPVSSRAGSAASSRRGGSSPKRKGSAFEREIVGILQAQGIAAERVPLSGAVKTSKFDHDISCPVRGADQRLECKRRARAFATIDQMLGSNFAVVVRDDRSRPMVVMDILTFARLAK